MTLYSINENGTSNLPSDHLALHDKTLTIGQPSFESRLDITADCMRSTFLGGDHAYDYLLESGTRFAIVTHPLVTFSCQDKIGMYNETGCNLTGAMGNGNNWELTDTIKAIYFWNKTTENYHIAVIPGKPRGTHIDQRKSFRDVCSELEISVKNRIRLFPVEKQLAFGVGLEGALSPLPPFYASKDDETIDSAKMIDAIYFDENHLDMYDPEDAAKLDDLSISMGVIACPEGQFIEREVGIEAARELRELNSSGNIPLDIRSEDGKLVAYVNDLLFGDYRPATIKEGEDKVTLRFSYIPNHILSLVMSYKDLFELLVKTFPGKVHAVDMKYMQPS